MKWFCNVSDPGKLRFFVIATLLLVLNAPSRETPPTT